MNGSYQNKIKPQNHHDSEIKVESSHKPDKNGKIFFKKAFQGSTFSHPGLLGTIRFKCQELYGHFLLSFLHKHQVSASQCCLSLADSPLSPEQRQHHPSDQTQLSHHTDLHAACSQSKAKPRHPEAEQGSAEPDKSVSCTSSESDASDSTAEKFQRGLTSR